MYEKNIGEFMDLDRELANIPEGMTLKCLDTDTYEKTLAWLDEHEAEVKHKPTVVPPEK